MTPPDYDEMARKLYGLASNAQRNPNFVIDVIKENLLHAQTVGKTAFLAAVEDRLAYATDKLNSAPESSWQYWHGRVDALNLILLVLRRVG